MCKEDEPPISIYRAQLRRAARNYFFNDYFFLSEAVKIFAIVVVITDIAGTIADTGEIIGGEKKSYFKWHSQLAQNFLSQR